MNSHKTFSNNLISLMADDFSKKNSCTILHQTSHPNLSQLEKKLMTT